MRSPSNATHSSIRVKKKIRTEQDICTHLVSNVQMVCSFASVRSLRNITSVRGLEVSLESIGKTVRQSSANGRREAVAVAQRRHESRVNRNGASSFVNLNESPPKHNLWREVDQHSRYLFCHEASTA